MTVLVAVHDLAGGWAVGADSATWEGPLTMAPLPAGSEKIRQLPDGTIVATCGTFALTPLLARAVEDTDSDRYSDRWAQTVTERWSDLGRAHRHLDEGQLDGAGYLAHGDRCWDLTENLALPLASWSTTGAGREVAAGAVGALLPSEMPAADIARRAIEVTIGVHRDCAGRPLIYTTCGAPG